MVDLGLTYDYYKDTYKGSLEETVFNKYIVKATLFLDTYTFGRLSKLYANPPVSQNLADRISLCICQLVDLYDLQPIGSKVVSREQVGEWSVSYNTGNSSSSFNREATKIIDAYLGVTGLLTAWV